MLYHPNSDLIDYHRCQCTIHSHIDENQYENENRMDVRYEQILSDSANKLARESLHADI